MADRGANINTPSGTKRTFGTELEALRVRLLGGFSVSVGSRSIQQNAWRLRRAAALVKLLALAPRHRLHREQVVEALWTDSGKKAATSNMRKALHAARRALDPVEGSRYLASENDSLVLGSGGSLWVDVQAFEEAAATARRGCDPAAYRAALDLYAGDLLPEDRYEEWAEDHRQGLRTMFISLLVELATAHEDRGEHRQGVEALRRAVAEDPILEEAHAGLMRLYVLLGQKAEALAQYERLRETLSSQLGMEPNTATERLHDEVASGEFSSALFSPTGPPQEKEPLYSSRHNLPAPRTSFIGREREMLVVKRELAMTRLLTLTGTGGSGKTRLVVEVARSLVGAYPDGVWLVELAPISEGTLVPQALARALGVKERPGQSLTETLAEVLRTKQTLLVLDNCEHLVEAVARLVDVLLDACPGVRVLVTSRERLGIAGEMNWLVPSLSVPDPRQQPTAEELERYESVRLFAERARHRNPAFVLSPQNVQAVARICERLEGIPLAIELAAARVGLSLEQIASRLDDSLGLLTTGSRTATARQRTLRGALDWSHDLLSEPERVLFGRLSVFAGGWTLEAAGAVASGEGVKEEEVLDLLTGLVDKSLVVALATGKGGVRYRMLEPVRQYARKKLEGSEVEEVRHRHLTYFLALAEDAEPKLRGPEDMKWLERLETEHDNLRAALSWALQQGEAVLALRLAGALWMFWGVHGHYREGRKWLEEALAKDDRASVAARVKALEAVCSMALDQWDLDRGEEAAHEGIALSSEVEIGSNLAASFRTKLGFAAWSRGDYERAKELLEESLTLSREADDKLRIADALLWLGYTSANLGDRAQAKKHFDEGITLCREIGYPYLLPIYMLSLGYVLLVEGDYERGAALNKEAATLFRERGYKGNLEYALDNLGCAALLQGDLGRARISYQESLALCKELGNRVLAADSLEGMACICAAEGASERAARLFGAAAALRETLRASVADYNSPEEDAWREPYLATARLKLGEAAWEKGLARGRAMGLEEAIEYALSEDVSSTIASRTPEQTSDSARPSSPVASGRWPSWWREGSPTDKSPWNSSYPSAPSRTMSLTS